MQVSSCSHAKWGSVNDLNGGVSYWMPCLETSFGAVSVMPRAVGLN